MITRRSIPSTAKRTVILGAGASSLLLGLVAAWAADAPSPGIPTTVMVRVVGNRAMVLGDAVSGAAVQIISPTPDRPLGIGDGVTIRTTVNMMCDCIVEPFGNWDSRTMELYAEVRIDDTVIGHVEFFHQGPKGIFQGDYTIPKWLKGKDWLALRVVASDEEGINVGYDEITYPLVPWEQSRDATGRDIPPISK